MIVCFVAKILLILFNKKEVYLHCCLFFIIDDLLKMKWDGFVVYEGSEKKPTSPISHLDASHCRSSLSNHKPFFLKTCEKLKTSNSKSGAKDKIIGNQENF